MAEGDRYSRRMIEFFDHCHHKLRKQNDPHCAVGAAAKAFKFHLTQHFGTIQAIARLTEETLAKLQLHQANDIFAEDPGVVREEFWRDLEEIVAQAKSSPFVDAVADGARKAVEMGAGEAGDDVLERAFHICAEEVADKCLHDVLVGGKGAIEAVTEQRAARNLEPVDVRAFFREHFVPQGADLIEQTLRKEAEKLRIPGRQQEASERFQTAELHMALPVP